MGLRDPLVFPEKIIYVAMSFARNRRKKFDCLEYFYRMGDVLIDMIQENGS